MTCTKSEPIPDEIVKELVYNYVDTGESLEGLVARYSYSYRRIRTALLDEGVQLRPPNIPLPPTPPGMVNAYLHGNSLRRLSTTYGLGYNQVRNILLAEGVTLRGRGAEPRVPRMKPPAIVEKKQRASEIPNAKPFEELTDRQQAAALAALYRDGASFLDLAALTGRSYSWVRRRVIEEGVEIRPRRSGRPLPLSERTIVKRYLAGFSIKAIVRSHPELYHRRVRNILLDAGVQLRTSTEEPTPPAPHTPTGI